MYKAKKQLTKGSKNTLKTDEELAVPISSALTKTHRSRLWRN